MRRWATRLVLDITCRDEDGQPITDPPCDHRVAVDTRRSETGIGTIRLTAEGERIGVVYLTEAEARTIGAALLMAANGRYTP